jgi:hypothetical protein
MSPQKVTISLLSWAVCNEVESDFSYSELAKRLNRKDVYTSVKSVNEFSHTSFTRIPFSIMT